MAEMEKTGKIVPDSRIDFGRIGLGVVVREGSAFARHLDTRSREGGTDQGETPSPTLIRSSAVHRSNR